jgi:hypothetical protein
MEGLAEARGNGPRGHQTRKRMHGEEEESETKLTKKKN